MKIIRLTQANLKGTASTPPTLHGSSDIQELAVKTDTFGAPYTNDYVLYRRLQDRGVSESITYLEFLKLLADTPAATDSARLEPKPHKTDSIGSSFTLDFLWAYGRKPVDPVADVERLAADFDKQINKDDGTYYAQDYLQDNLSYNGYHVSVGDLNAFTLGKPTTDSFSRVEQWAKTVGRVHAEEAALETFVALHGGKHASDEVQQSDTFWLAVGQGLHDSLTSSEFKSLDAWKALSDEGALAEQLDKDFGKPFADNPSVESYLSNDLAKPFADKSLATADLDLKVALAKTDSFELSDEQRYDLGKGLADLPTSSETVEKVASWYRVFDRHFDSYFAESYVEENVDYSSNLVAGVVETLSLGFSTGFGSSFGKQSRVTLHPKPLYVESLSNSDSVAFDMTSSLEDIPETHSSTVLSAATERSDTSTLVELTSLGTSSTKADVSNLVSNPMLSFATSFSSFRGTGDSCAKAILPGVVEEISAPEILDMHMQDYFASSDYVSNSYLGQTYTF
jgi:hypothetical protein